MAKPINILPSAAWRSFLPELVSVTVDIWGEDDYADDPAKELFAANLDKGNLTADVLDEIDDCLTRDWCVGRLQHLAWVILAANGRMDVYDPNAVSTRRLKTQVINGTRYIVG